MRVSTGSWRSTGMLTVCCLLVSACTLHPDRKPPGPLNEPIDAFEAVGRPQGAGPGDDGDSLGADVRQLQDAHQAYLRDQARQAAEVRRRQAVCRKQAGAREVAIQDGSGDPDATFCQSRPTASQ